MAKQKAAPAPKSAESRGKIGDVTVWCRFDELVAIAEIKPNPQNYNQHPPRQIKILAKVIQANGWRAPVTVSTLSGFVTKGHGRLEAAKLLGLESVPVEYQHYESAKQEYEDLIADNRIALLADEDPAMLRKIINDESIGIDPELAGLCGEVLGTLAKAFEGREREAKEIKWPIVILKSEDEYHQWCELKKAHGVKSDENMFSICLSKITNQGE